MIDQLNVKWQTLWQEENFTHFTHIQELIAKPIQSGEDLVALSPTGSGKTLAYLWPILDQLTPDQTLQAVVLAPTQELAVQIGEVAQKWAEPLGLQVQTIIGGVNLKRQIDALIDKPELIVATPGRLEELFVKSRKLKFHQVKTIVFDEADFLFNEIHAKNTQQVEHRLLRDVQKIYVSATFGEALQTIAKANDLPVYQGEEGLNLVHWYLETRNRQKNQQLRRLSRVDGMQAIVFFQHIDQLKQAQAKLTYDGVQVVSLYGEMNAQDRRSALDAFRQGEATYLLTTDVASRGLDLPEIPYVINYDRPETMEVYQHRAGRTGRRGQFGIVLSLLNSHELQQLSSMWAGVDGHLIEKRLYRRELVDPQVVAQQDEKAQNKKPKKSTRRKKSKRNKRRHRHQRNKGKPRRRK